MRAGGWALLILLLVSQAACQASPPPPVITPEPTLENALPQVEPPTRVKGRLVPGQSATLVMWSSGRVSQLLVDSGECVQEGTVLLRLESYPSRLAQIKAKELELILAQQALDELVSHAELDLARAELVLAQAEDRAALTRDLYTSKVRQPSELSVSQAQANLRLAEQRLTSLQDDLAKLESRYNNPDSPIWFFTNRRTIRLQITSLGAQVAAAEQRVRDAREKVDDLQQPPDEIEVALAQREMELAAAELNHARQERDSRLGGPDPHALEQATSRLRAAQAELDAAKVALLSAELSAPFSGCVVGVETTPGEWVNSGQTVISLADQTYWQVETVDVTELMVPRLREGQLAQVTLDAYPELLFTAKVTSIDQIYTRDEDEIHYGVKLSLPEGDPRLRWGLTARVDFSEGTSP